MAAEGPGGRRVVVLVPPVGAVPVVVRTKEEAACLLRIRAVSSIAPVGERALVDVADVLRLRADLHVEVYRVVLVLEVVRAVEQGIGVGLRLREEIGRDL